MITSNKIAWSEVDLRRLYVDEGKTQAEIAALWGVHQGTIGVWLRECGIKGRRVGTKQSVFLPEDELRRMYLDEKADIRDIRAHFKCGTGTITRTLRRMGILRSHEERKAVRTDKLRAAILDKYRSGELEYTTLTTNKGYQTVKSLDRHYTGVHILVAEKAIGRPVTKNEGVHHIDMRKLNNVPENLAVLSRKDHGRLHKYLERCAVYVFCGGLRPATLDFGHEVFWGGKYVTSIDLIERSHGVLAADYRHDHGAIPDFKTEILIQ